MQDVIILTQQDPIASSPERLVMLDYQGRQIAFLSQDAQRVNILALQQQQLPCVVILDGVRQGLAGLEVDAGVMLSVMPMNSGDISAVLSAGAADRLVRFARGEPV